MIPDPPELAAAKQAARAAALERRAGCDPEWGALLAGHVLRDCPPPAGAVVSGFWPLPGEIDIRPLLHALLARGHKVALPVTPKRGQPLLFRQWTPERLMLPGRFGTRHPDGPELRPDWLLVPLLAFDRRGHRLGYGAGFYDRTLAGLPGAQALGCAFAAQEMAEVPVGEADFPLAAVATERGIILCGDT